jgi:hypothetical protein
MCSKVLTAPLTPNLNKMKAAQFRTCCVTQTVNIILMIVVVVVIVTNQMLTSVLQHCPEHLQRKSK